MDDKDECSDMTHLKQETDMDPSYSTRPVAINFAPASELTRIPGIGSGIASAIVSIRENSGNITPQVLETIMRAKLTQSVLEIIDFTLNKQLPSTEPDDSAHGLSRDLGDDESEEEEEETVEKTKDLSADQIMESLQNIVKDELDKLGEKEDTVPKASKKEWTRVLGIPHKAQIILTQDETDNESLKKRSK